MELNDRYKIQDLKNLTVHSMKVQYDSDSSQLLSVGMHIPRRDEIFQDKNLEVKPNYVELLGEIDKFRQILKRHKITIYDDINFRDCELHGPCFDLLNIQNYAFLDSQLLIQSSSNTLNNEMVYLMMMKNGYNDKFAKLSDDIKMSGNDIIRINENHYIVGIGNNTNEEFVELLEKINPTVKIHTVNLRKGYLNDYMFSPNSNTIVYRSSIVVPEIKDIRLIRIDDIKSFDEVKTFNVVVLKNNTLLISKSAGYLIDILKGYAKIETIDTTELNKLNIGLNQIILPILRKNIK